LPSSWEAWFRVSGRSRDRWRSESCRAGESGRRAAVDHVFETMVPQLGGREKGAGNSVAKLLAVLTNQGRWGSVSGGERGGARCTCGGGDAGRGRGGAVEAETVSERPRGGGTGRRWSGSRERRIEPEIGPNHNTVQLRHLVGGPKPARRATGRPK